MPLSFRLRCSLVSSWMLFLLFSPIWILCLSGLADKVVLLWPHIVADVVVQGACHSKKLLTASLFSGGLYSLIAFSLSGDGFSPSLVKTCPNYSICPFPNWRFSLLNVTAWSLACWRTVFSTSLCSATSLPPRSMSSLWFRQWGMSLKALNIASPKTFCEDLAPNTCLFGL